VLYMYGDCVQADSIGLWTFVLCAVSCEDAEEGAGGMSDV